MQAQLKDIKESLFQWNQSFYLFDLKFSIIYIELP